MTYSSLEASAVMANLRNQMAQIRNKKLIRKISTVIKALRAESGKTQVDVSDDLKIHIGRLETSNANPTVSTIAAICHYFDISLSDFYKRVEAEK